MYISRVLIHNYKSIKNIDIKFKSGKNIIVGKNNSGKSNIIKAIDLVLGENSPTYAKSNNVLENDFFCNKTEKSDKIMIFCELMKNNDENIDMSQIPPKFYAKYILDLYEEKDLIDNADEIYNSMNDYESKGMKLNSIYKATSNFESRFEEIISSCPKIGFLFTAKLESDIISKDLKMLAYNNNSKKWIVIFNNSLRNILLQSAIIPAFREPSYQLSLSQWSWYGKMMKNITNSLSDEKWKEYEDASKKITDISNSMFDEVTTKINEESLKIAFPNTKLYFKFLEENKADLYKGTKIFVDDGFLSDLSSKGAGIQSSIIIGLFTYYIKNISKIKNALLCLEEPELFLHPQGKRVISNRVNDFLSAGENQAIIVTHAEEFIELKNRDSKVIKIDKDEQQGSIAYEIILNDCKEVILNNNNKEIFFADKVILCEGKDKLLFEFFNLNMLDGRFDDENISIITVNGKGNFKKYINIAQKLNVKVYIVADFDYILRDSDEDKLKLYNKNNIQNIYNLSPQELEYISNIDNVNNLQRFISKIKDKLKEYDEKKFYCSKNKEDYDDFKFNYKNKEYNISECLAFLEKNNIFIEDGEIEDLFVNKMDKMSEDDIYNLYSSEDINKEFVEEKLKRILDFFTKI